MFRKLTSALVIVLTASLSACSDGMKSSEITTEEKRSRSNEVFRYSAIVLSNKKIGDVYLGRTTLRDSLDLFPSHPPGYPGTPRPGVRVPNFITYDEKNLARHPRTVYNPWESMYQLWFDEEEILKVIVDAMPPEYGKGIGTMKKKYPGLHLVGPDKVAPHQIIYQSKINNCVILTVWAPREDKKISVTAYSHICD